MRKNKLITKLISMAVCVALCITNVMPAFAETGVQTIPSSFTGEEQVTVNIPQKIVLDYSADENKYTKTDKASVTGKIAAHKCVSVTSPSTAVYASVNNSSLTYTGAVDFGTEHVAKWTKDQVASETAVTQDITISVPADDIKYADTYKSELEFTIKVDWDETNPAYFTHTDSVITGMTDEGITAVNNGENVIIIPREIDGTAITEIGANAFDNSKSPFKYGKITKMILLDNITKINSEAFKKCRFKVCDISATSLTSIDTLAFDGVCLNSLTVPFEVTEIDNWFGEYGGTSDITFLTSPTTFKATTSSSGDKSVKKVTLCGTTITKAFGSFIKNTDALGETGEYKIPASVTSIEDSALSNWLALKTLSYEEIPCGYYVTGVMRDRVYSKLETIGANAFAGCTNLTKVDLGFNVKAIKTQAFAGCSSLTTLRLPSYLLTYYSADKAQETVGANAFNGCALTDIYSILTPTNTMNGIHDTIFTLDGHADIDNTVDASSTSYINTANNNLVAGSVVWHYLSDATHYI